MSNKNKKKIVIHQKSICLDQKSMANYLVLIETVDNIPVATYLVKIPKTFAGVNSFYPYYGINDN